MKESVPAKEGVQQRKVHCGKSCIVEKAVLWKRPHCGKVKNMRKKFGMRA